jgi:hypothetical protein
VVTPPIDVHSWSDHPEVKGLTEKRRWSTIALPLANGTTIISWKSLVRTVLWTLFLACIPVWVYGQSAENPNYPVVVVDRDAGVVAIVDEINFRLPLAFERVLEVVPNVRTLLLHSPGGEIHAALAVASRVRSLGLTTRIDRNSGCYSACSMIFFAGTSREVEGELGVHQISSETGNLVSGQFALADIFEVLASFDVPTEVIGIMLRTPPEDMYVFSAEEISRYGLRGDALRGDPSMSGSPRPRQPIRGDIPEPVIDYLDPATWHDTTVTGELISSGGLWYSELRADGSTTFQSASGRVVEGRYRIRGRSVCYDYQDASEEVCRTPIAADGRIRWVDDAGDASSYIINVEPQAPISQTGDSTTASSDVIEAIGPGRCALIVAARRTVEEARDYVLSNITDQRFIQGYLTDSGWIAISIGTLGADESRAVMNELKTSQRIPEDSYCSQGRTLQALVDIR